MSYMRISCDLHLHSNHSIDGENTIEEMCQAASEKGLTTICFAEHFDMNPEEEYGYFDFGKYSDDVERAREKFSQKMIVLKGIEFGEPHLYRKEFEYVSGLDLDFILASIHYVEDFGAYWDDEIRLQPGYPIQRLFESYYQEVLKAIEFGGFDAIAHIDFPKRYFTEKHEPDGLLDNIVKMLVDKEIALEINSSPMHEGGDEVHPSNYICDLYAKNGGKIVTVGSDAHSSDRIGQNFNRITDILQVYAFQPVCFFQRNEIALTEPQ
jgi:histidinol-phosphatase (PHP family)